MTTEPEEREPWIMWFHLNDCVDKNWVFEMLVDNDGDPVTTREHQIEFEKGKPEPVLVFWCRRDEPSDDELITLYRESMEDDDDD